MSKFDGLLERAKKNYSGSFTHNITENGSGSKQAAVSPPKSTVGSVFDGLAERARANYGDSFRSEEQRSTVVDWMDRYNRVMQGVSAYDKKRNGGYTQDASGGFGSEIDSLIADFDGIKGYAADYGFMNSGNYLNQLKALQNSIQGINDNFSQFEDEDAYNRYMDYWKDQEEKRNLDLDAYSREIADLERQLEDYDPQIDWTDTNQRKQYDAGLKQLEDEISRRKQYMAQAQRLQKKDSFSAVADPESDKYDAAFDSKSGYVSTEQDGKLERLLSQYSMGYDDLTYEYINNQNGIRDTIKQKAGAYKKGETPFEAKGYDYMTEDEVGLYNYYYSMGGKASAEAYLDTIQEDLNQRKAAGMYQQMEGKTGAELVFGIEAGLDQFKGGIKGAVRAVKGDDSYVAPSATQYASGMVREDLADDGAKLPSWLGGASLGQVGYDAITTTANMAPSIAVGMLNPTLGTAALGVSAGGSAYQEALNEGYSVDQARGYGILSGASEVIMEKVLGGISAYGGNSLGKFFTQNMKNADTALKRIAKELGGSMLSEFSEEYLQEVLTPVFQNLTLGTDNEVKLVSAEALYAGFLGAITGGIMEGPKAIANARNATEVPGNATVKESLTTELANSEENATADNVEAVTEESPAVDDKMSATENAPTLEALSEKYGDRAADMRKTFMEGQDIQEYDRAFQMAYDMGKAGVNESYAQRSEATAYLSETQRSIAYNMGALDAQSAAGAQAAKNAAAANGKTGWRKGTVKGQGVKIADMSKAFNDPQRKAYKYLTNIAEVTGVDIVLYKSETDADGNYQGAQGKFKWNENTIYIDINAGLDHYANADQLAKYTMMRTFDHEFTHFIEKWNPEEYNSFRSLVFETMESNGTNVEDAIELMMEKTGNALTYDQASRELIAEAMTDILPETSFIEQLARKNQNVFQQLLSKLKEFLTSIKQHFASMSNSNQEAKALKKQMGETVSYIEEIVKKFDEVAVKAVENYQRTVAEDATVSKEEKVVAKTETATEATTEAKPAAVETVVEDKTVKNESTVEEKPVKDENTAPAVEEYRSEHGYTIRPNEQYGSLEITFDGKPSQAVRDALKANKFRWNGKKGVWYGKTDQKTIVDSLDKAYQPRTADPVDLSQKPMERTVDTVTIGDPAKATHEVEVTLSDEEYEALMQAVPEKQEATEPAPATESAQEVPPKAETEEAKQELRKAVRMPIQGTNAEALLQGIKSKELSMESITLSGSVDGFNDQQRHHLVSRLLEGVYTDSEVIKIDVPYDGKFEIINTPGNVAKVLDNLKVRVNQEAMFDKKTISLLTSNGDVRIVELDGQKYLSNSYVMIPATDAGIEYIKAEFNGKEMTLHPPVAEAFQRADKPLTEAPTEAKLGKTNVLIFRIDGKQLYFDKRYFAPLDGGQLFYAEINGAGILKSVDASGNVLGYLMGIKPGKDSKITNEKPSNLKSYQKKKGTGITTPKSAEKPAPAATEAASPVPEEKPDTQKKTAAKAAKPATVETSVKLEDFGEKIGGARKDQWSKRGLLADDLTDMNDRERDKNVKKDNVWKRPDYRKLIEGGADRNILFVRNEIRKTLNQNIAYPYRTTEEQRLRIQKEFIETVREIQAMAEKVSSKEDLLAMGRPWLKANGYIQESGTSYTEKWRKNPALMGTDYVYTIEHLARNFDNLTKLADKANFAVDAEKKIPNGFSIHEDDSNHTWFITRGSWIVKHSFPSYDDALNYLRNAASNSKKKTRFVPQQLLEVHRKGPDYRSSKDVKGQDYLDTFGFKGGEFGNWMSEKDRRVSMNYGFDALKDLADALGIADTDISLGGNLSIAFGARGQGLSGAAAHYEQERHVINLTKMNGAGSLAHEWFHALDDFLGGYGSKFATEYGAKLPEATKAAVRHLLTTMQYRDATQEETDMAATKAYEQAKRSVTYQVSNQFGWVQKVENGTFQDHDARYYTRKPTAADAGRYHALLDKLLETGNAAIVDELSALRKEVTGHVIPKEDRDSIGFRLSALRPAATRNVQKMRLRSDFYNGSRRFGELHHKDGDYWDSTIEMAARAFACYVADKTGKHNDYLSAHSDTAATLDVDKNGNVSVVRAYPTGQERVQINAAFDQLFAALKEDGFLHQQGEVTKPDIIQYQRRPGEVRRFNYEWFTSKPDMAITEVERVGKVNTRELRSQIIEKAIENAKSVGTVNELGNPVVHVKDTGKDVVISKTGIRHSMDRRADVVGSVAVKIGDILSNAILMNELNPRSENITDSYILIAAAKNKTNEPYIVSFVVNRYTSEVTDIDVLYAVNAKKEPAGSNSPSITVKNTGYFTGSTVTISNLLDFVNQYFPDTMPEDVLKHYGHDRRPDGTLGQDALYQQRYGTLTDRDILDLAANDLRIDEMTEKERNALNVFRDRLAKLQKLQQERFELGRQYRQQQFMPEGDRKAAASTLAQMRDLDSRIETISDKILNMEERSVLKEVLKKARKIVEEKQKDHDDEIIRNRRNRRNEAANARKYRQQITKNAKTLMDWITKPSNKDVMKHVPDVLKDSVIPLLNQIDFTSKQQLNGKEATKADLEFAKRLKKVKSVLDKDISAAELNSGYYDFSPQFREKLDSVVAEVRALAENSSGEFVLNRMSAKDLKDLAEVIHELKQLIQNYNRLHNNALFENAYEAGGSTIDEMSQYQNAPDRGKAGEAAHRFLFWKQMRPIHGWDRLGKGGLSVFHEFWSGHSRYAFNVKKVIDFTEKTFTEEEVNAWEKETVDIELSDGIIVRMKIAHIMSFHELRKDADSLRHILGDGLRVPVYRASDGKKVSDDGHLLTIEDVNTIANTLTERQVEVADALQQFMATQGAKWGNEVSMKRFGEAMFTNPTYFPINSDGQRLQATINEREDGSDLYALLNVGFTKSRNENASNRIVLYSIFDVFTNHMATMAQYNAFALPILDALKWLNYQKTEEVTVTENGQQKTVRKTVDSVREQLNRVFGAPAEENGRAKHGYAEEFILNIIRDFNGSKIQGSPNEGLFKKLLHNYNVAQVSTNLSVAIQQISSIVRAGQVINYKTILRARKLKPEVVKRNISEMEKYSGIAVWKSMGFYDINVSRNLSDLIKHNASFQEKVNEKGLAGAEWADKVTWAAIWCSCKEEVLLRGTKYEDPGFFDAVTKLFDEVIYRTQVVDSILTKNEYMRDPSFIPRFTSSFMNESVTIASMVMSTMDKYQMDLQKGLSKQEAWQRNKKAIGVTVGIYSVGAILNAAFRAVMGAFRDDDEYETYGEKYWEAFKGNLVDELMPFNKIPIASDAYEIVKELVGVVTDYFWDYEIYGNAPETITGQLTDKGVKAVEILCQKLSGEDTGYTWYALIRNLLQVASGLSGLPMANFVREVVTFWNNTAGSLAPSLKVRTYEPTVKNAIKYAYLDGYLTYEEATEELLTNNQVDSQNEAHWIIKSWEGGKGYSKFGAVYQAMLEDGDVDAEMANYLPYGYTETEVLNNVKSMIGTAFRDGEITKEAAMDLLTRYFDMDTEDITAQINRWSAKVETGIAFDDIKDAFIYGEITEKQAIDMYMRYGGYTQKDARITVTEWKAQKETGVSMSDLEEQFVRGSVSEKDAIDRLQKYSGVAKTEAESRVQEWKCEKDTGIPYDELNDRYVAGKITASRAQELRVEYGGSSQEDARKTVLKWDCEKDHGIKYGELSTAYLSGDISKNDAINWQMEYGEISEDKAKLAVQAWVWRADNPKYKDLSDQKIDRFITHCVPAHIDVAFYYKAQDFVKRIESDGTSGNVKKQYVDYILSLNLDDDKAKAMWQALKNSTWKDSGTPFA